MLFQAEYIAEWNTNCGREKKKRQINRQKNTGNVYALFLNFLFSARSGELWARLFKERGKRVLHAVSGTLSVFLTENSHRFVGFQYFFRRQVPPLFPRLSCRASHTRHVDSSGSHPVRTFSEPCCAGCSRPNP